MRISRICLTKFANAHKTNYYVYQISKRVTALATLTSIFGMFIVIRAFW